MNLYYLTNYKINTDIYAQYKYIYAYIYVYICLYILNMYNRTIIILN